MTTCITITLISGEICIRKLSVIVISKDYEVVSFNSVEDIITTEELTKEKIKMDEDIFYSLENHSKSDEYEIWSYERMC